MSISLKEHLSHNQANLVTEAVDDGKGGKSLYMKGIFIEGDVRNQNNRIYTKEEIHSAVKAINEKIKSGYSVLGEADHPDDLNINLDRQAIARYGFNASDINDFIETAIGGKIATRVFEGQRSYSAAVRFPENHRNDVEAIKDMLMTAPNGSKIALKNLAQIELRDGPAQISREFAKRRIVVGINVKDRDLGGFVAELQKMINDEVKLPGGYYFEYGGQFENMQRALSHLAMIVPITIAAIFFLLFLLFNSIRYATMIITVLPFAAIGGVFGLAITGSVLTFFSATFLISSVSLSEIFPDFNSVKSFLLFFLSS